MFRPATVRRAVCVLIAATMIASTTACATRASMPSATSPSEASTPPSPTESAAPVQSATPTSAVDQEPPPSSSPTADATVILITLDVIAGTLEASGMVPGLVEEGGECTLTVDNGQQSRSVSGGTATGPESTYCQLLTIPSGELPRGEWEATLTYRSDGHSGTSERAAVSVP